jgi:hypothetical protein
MGKPIEQILALLKQYGLIVNIFLITSPTGWERDARKISLSLPSKAVRFLPFGISSGIVGISHDHWSNQKALAGTITLSSELRRNAKQRAHHSHRGCSGTIVLNLSETRDYQNGGKLEILGRPNRRRPVSTAPVPG